MGVLYSLQEAICAFKDFLRECRQHLNRFFDTKIYVLYGNVKAFCLACRRLRFVFLSVSAKTFLQPINLHTSTVGTFFILVVSGSLFAVRRYLFAPCEYLSAVRGFVFASCVQRFIRGREHVYCVPSAILFHGIQGVFSRSSGCPVQSSSSGSCLFLPF